METFFESNQIDISVVKQLPHPYPLRTMIWFKRKETKTEEKPGLFARLKAGLSRSSAAITEGLSSIVTKRKLDSAMLAEIEELLITADFGPQLASRLTAELGRERMDRDVSDEEVRAFLGDKIAALLQKHEKPIISDTAARPFVILFAGVNGTGKTTTIGKLAHQFREEGKSVMLAAGDTFRAAAVEQLKVWGERSKCPVVAKDIGSDAAALAYEAVEKAISENVDVLMIDTAGRLQNKTDLMSELEKVVRVIKKKLPEAPHAAVIVLDATTGQNAQNQVELFGKSVGITGIIMTKLDGTARGGTLVALAERFGLPVHAIGIGEGIEDLRPFEASSFSRSLMGLG